MNKLFICFSIAVMFAACSEKLKDVQPYIPSDPVNTYFAGEVTPHSQANCAMGSYYVKRTSALDTWRGITGIVTLPEIKFDSSRILPSNNKQFLDNASIYMGGTANGQETDIGLAWEVIKDANGVVSPDRKAYRPFLRRTGYNATGQAAEYISAPAIDKYYWYPGETVNISVKIISNGLLRLTIDGNNKKFDTTYAADGYLLDKPLIFKRVNAIDQVGNEGKPVQATKAQVIGAKWAKTSLIRFYNGNEVEAPMHNGRYTSLLCPQVKYFTITASDADLKAGAETITINGGM